MREAFYKLLTLSTRMCGTGLFVWISGLIAAGYFVLAPRRRQTSVCFYQALFPDRSRRFHLRCAWKQFQSFTSVFLDRYLLQENGAVHYTFEGRDHLQAALRQGTGGILLMTHIGNWEVGARLLRRSVPDLRLMLYMGRRARDQIERLQKDDLAASGIRIIAVDESGASPLDVIEAIGFIRSGGFVSMAGDVIWHPDQRAVEACFLRHTVRLPEAPFMLALVSGAPLYIFFAAGSGPRTYHFSLLPPIKVAAKDRAGRRAAVQQAVRAYLEQVETQLRRVPFQWYHFSAFLGSPEEAGTRPGTSERCSGTH